MFQDFVARLRKARPIITLLFVASVLLTTVPQFFLPDQYDHLTGHLASVDSLLYLTLPIFSHTPGILIAHLLVNLMVFLIFGSVTEMLLGSRRFALITACLFVVSLLLSYLRGGGVTHGISGVCWGYQAFGLFVLILYWERDRSRFFRDPLVYLFLVLLVFNFVGLPALEVLVQGQRFLENFGQYIHLASVVSTLPFLLIWRRQSEYNFACILERRSLHYPSFTGIPIALIGAILLFNTVGTVEAIRFTSSSTSIGQIQYTLDPPAGTPIEDVGDTIAVIFNMDMVFDSQQLTQRSITSSGDPNIDVTALWLNTRHIEISLSRSLEEEESLRLTYLVKCQTAQHTPAEVLVEIEYD